MNLKPESSHANDSTNDNLSNHEGDIRSESVCKVCGDVATGKHYSVLSCEGCKGFFKRTIQMKLAYNCRQNSPTLDKPTLVVVNGVTRCVIDHSTRNSCRKCRFDACISTGMNPGLIRNDNYVSRAKKRRMTRLISSHASRSYASKHSTRQASTNETATVPENMYFLTAEDDQLIEHLTHIEADKIPPGTPEGPVDDQLLGTTEQGLAFMFQAVYGELRDIVKWAGNVPGFTDIPTNDKMALIKNCFPEIIIFRLAWRSLPYENQFRLTDSKFVSKEETIELGIDRDLVARNLFFIQNTREVSLSKVEFCLIQAILLTFARCPNIDPSSQNTASLIQSRVMQCLKRYVKSKFPNDGPRFCKLVQLLSSIKSVSLKALDACSSFEAAGGINVNFFSSITGHIST
ncbi:retinoic acid receptor RXR-beta-B-like [Symsagittifera roscoffensis]|uniref:retinoic acid receptor RXR-beta-B-like n=1 Tax=Symsagittifera roscoffensis TaxID=84072 RepID=UPI00307BAC52